MIDSIPATPVGSGSAIGVRGGPAPSSVRRHDLRGVAAFLLGDPRHYQIVSLGTLLGIGVAFLSFPVDIARIVTTLSVALVTQGVASRWWGIPFEPRSALISSLSLLLILRAGSPSTLALAALVAITSKFLVRVRGKHLFNPANAGILAAVALTGDAWISPGQWGSAIVLLALFAGLGLVVTTRARRVDITLAFLVFHAAVVFGRALWLGDPLAIPWRSLQSGTLMLFAFFMLSDPRTTPDRRSGRVLFALAVAAVAGWITYGLHEPNGFIWALGLTMPLVPLIDHWLPGRRHAWRANAPARAVRPCASPTNPGESEMNVPAHDHDARVATRRHPSRRLPWLTAAGLLLLTCGPVLGFCGFYVAKADTELFNRASEVVLVRDGDRTVLTMSNDFRGEPEEFAMVIPVPTLLRREQIHVGDRALIDHLDAYTAPRLVEYHDPDPCARPEMRRLMAAPSAAPLAEEADAMADQLGVTIEARYTIGEYDILILSAEQSDGLEEWLVANGYRLPDGASAVLGSYLRQNMRFFVARVNLEEQAKLGFQMLRPLQIAYESPKFMLPIRLGTLNADGDQELFVYTLTRRGRVETTNYRTVRLPTGDEVPTFVEHEFGDFYRAMFDRQVEDNRRGVFLEYAWDMGWCDPCAADPLSADELRRLGVFWIEEPRGFRPPAGGPQNVFVTRLHVRYNAQTFPEDLRFQETTDRTNFQGRYVLRHPWTGSATCAAGERYRAELEQRLEREAQRLASLTGWDLGEIREKIRSEVGVGPVEEPDEPWWRRLWPGR